MARLSTDDHRSSKGAKLTDATMILRQDRANYHRFNKRDLQDTGDPLFSDETRRGQLCALVSMTKEIEHVIVRRTPLVRVKATMVRVGYICDVTVIDPGAPLPKDDVPPGGCVVEGVIYDRKGQPYGCEGGGNWCSNAKPLRGGCKR